MEYQVPEDHLSTSQSWKEYCWHELFVVLVTIIKKHSILRNHHIIDLQFTTAHLCYSCTIKLIKAIKQNP